MIMKKETVKINDRIMDVYKYKAENIETTYNSIIDEKTSIIILVEATLENHIFFENMLRENKECTLKFLCNEYPLTINTCYITGFRCDQNKAMEINFISYDEKIMEMMNKRRREQWI